MKVIILGNSLKNITGRVPLGYSHNPKAVGSNPDPANNYSKGFKFLHKVLMV